MKQEVTREQIRTWNRMFEASKGTNKYLVFSLQKEWMNGKRWTFEGHGDIRGMYIERPFDHYFIKKVGENSYLYYEDCGGVQERWLLSDIAKAFFGV